MPLSYLEAQLQAWVWHLVLGEYVEIATGEVIPSEMSSAQPTHVHLKWASLSKLQGYM